MVQDLGGFKPDEQCLMYACFAADKRAVSDALDARSTIVAVDIVSARGREAAGYALRWTDNLDFDTPRIALADRAAVCIGVGRTTDPYKNAAGATSTDNTETLHSLRTALLSGRVNQESLPLLVVSCFIVHNGGGVDGKLPSLSACLPSMVSAPPKPVGVTKTQHVQRCREQMHVRACQEMALRYAVAHMLLLGRWPSTAGCARSERIALQAAEVAASGLDAQPLGASFAVAWLGSAYAPGWRRLCDSSGPWQIYPHAAVKATATQWELLGLAQLLCWRREPNLLCAMPPNEGALAAGLLQEELGSGLPRRWASPYEVILARAGAQCAGRPAPLWYQPEDEPPLPSDAELDRAAQWAKSGIHCKDPVGVRRQQSLSLPQKRPRSAPKTLADYALQS